MKKFPTFNRIVAQTKRKVRIKDCVSTALEAMTNGSFQYTSKLTGQWRVHIGRRWETKAWYVFVYANNTNEHKDVSFNLHPDEAEKLQTMAMQKSLETK